jgi:formate C-acetyltransferase
LSAVLTDNYHGHEDWQKLFKNETLCYGLDNDDVLNITNDILAAVSAAIDQYSKSGTGRKIKFGLSSPSYISGANTIAASADGRKAGEPFAVHISNDKNRDFTSLFSFASKIDYSGNRFNGNVVDFIVSPSFIDNNFDQFVSMLKGSFLSGVFEMQFNVLSSKLLLEAKKAPEKFQHLVVRVWGFSAYFNDLPEEYKDALIKRTMAHENAA